MKNLNSMAQEELQEIISKLEGLRNQKDEIAAEEAEILKDAKNGGFDTKIIRKVLAIRRKGKAEHEEEQALLEAYLHAIGQLDGTPLADYGRQQLEGAVQQ